MEYFKIIGNEEKELNLTEEEKTAFEFIFKMLKDSEVDIQKLQVTRKSNAYATIVICGKEWDYDLIRFKMTDKTKWISLPIANSDRTILQDNPLFDAQKNKAQLHWKSKLLSIKELPKYKVFIVSSYLQCLDINKENFD